jgi:hypothetical protein
MTVRLAGGSDSGVEQARREFADIERMRDSLLSWVGDHCDRLLAQIDAALPTIPRPHRQQLEKARRKVVNKRIEIEAMIGQKFEEVTRGFDVETGTLAGVQHEAAEMIANALKDLA